MEPTILTGLSSRGKDFVLGLRHKVYFYGGKVPPDEGRVRMRIYYRGGSRIQRELQGMSFARRT